MPEAAKPPAAACPSCGSTATRITGQVTIPSEPDSPRTVTRHYACEACPHRWSVTKTGQPGWVGGT